MITMRHRTSPAFREAERRCGEAGEEHPLVAL